MELIDNNEEINIGRLFRYLLFQSKFIFILTLLGFILGLSNYIFSPKTYKISSLLQVYEDGNNLSSGSMGLDLFGSSSTTDINLLVNLYKTRSNILDLIKEFDLNIILEDDLKFQDIELNLDDLNSSNTIIPVFYFKFFADYYEFYNSEKELISNLSYSEYHSLKGINILIDSPNAEFGRLYKVILYSPSDLYLTYLNKLNIEIIESTKFNSSGGFLKISMLTDEPNLGIDILNYSNNLFLKDIIKNETEEARKAIKFIDEQLISLNYLLESKKENLKNFKKENQSINVDLEIQSIIESIATIEENLNLIDVDLAEASQIYTDNNPLIKSISSRKNILLLQKQEIENRIRNLPVAEQEYIDLYREVEISTDLYTELTNRKLSFSIMEASNLGNIRVVDEAFNEYQVGPRLFTVILITFFFFALSIIIALIRGNYFLPISNPAEINDTGISAKVYGVIPSIDTDGDNEDVLEDVGFNRSVESLIVNIKSSITDDGSKLLLFTSPTENNGKSLLSRSVAKKLASMNHRVLLIDNDLIRGDQNRFFNTKKMDSETFYELNENNLNSIQHDHNFFLIPKISKLNDTFNFLYSDRYVNKLNELKAYFDFIIIDTAPALSVTDTSILMKYADLNFLIVRHSVSRPSQIKQSWYMSDQIGTEFNGIVYNDYSKPKGYYGYYQLYGDYRYQYYAEKYLYEYGYKKNE